MYITLFSSALCHMEVTLDAARWWASRLEKNLPFAATCTFQHAKLQKALQCKIRLELAAKQQGAMRILQTSVYANDHPQPAAFMGPERLTNTNISTRTSTSDSSITQYNWPWPFPILCTCAFLHQFIKISVSLYKACCLCASTNSSYRPVSLFTQQHFARITMHTTIRHTHKWNVIRIQDIHVKSLIPWQPPIMMSLCASRYVMILPHNWHHFSGKYVARDGGLETKHIFPVRTRALLEVINYDVRSSNIHKSEVSAAVKCSNLKAGLFTILG